MRIFNIPYSVKNIIFIVMLITLIFTSCKPDKLTGYQQFKSFDEYKLQECDSVFSKENMNGYFSIKRSNDQINVVVHYPDNEFIKNIVYTRRQTYWYSKGQDIKSEDNGSEPGYIYKNEKYIFQDTILLYDYINHNNKIVFKQLTISTPKDFYYLFFDSTLFSKQEDYFSLRNYLSELKSSLVSDIYHSKYLEVEYFEKKIVGDKLFIYSKDLFNNKLKNRCLNLVYQINNLGELGLDRAAVITSEYYENGELPCE